MIVRHGPTGVAVNVSDEKGERLLRQGFTQVEDERPKASARKSGMAKAEKSEDEK